MNIDDLMNEYSPTAASKSQQRRIKAIQEAQAEAEEAKAPLKETDLKAAVKKLRKQHGK